HVTVKTGAGDDFLNVFTDAGTLTTLFAPLSLDGGGGANRLFVYEALSAVGDTVVLTPTSLSDTAQSFNIGFLATGGSFSRGIWVTTGAGDDTVMVEGTPAGTDARVYTLGGNDTVYVGTFANNANTLGGTLTVDTGAGSNRLSVLDGGRTAANT